MNSHAPIFHMQSYWWVWFPAIEPRILEINEGSGAKYRKFSPAKISHYTVLVRMRKPCPRGFTTAQQIYFGCKFQVC